MPTCVSTAATHWSAPTAARRASPSRRSSSPSTATHRSPRRRRRRVAGAPPFAAQMLMLRYWNAHGQPRVLRTVPGLPINDVVIEPRGREAVRIGETVVRLDRYVVDGVVWGRETIWLDERGAIAAAITRAGGLSFEAVREDLEPALGGFIERAARDRISDLENLTRQLPLLKSGTYAMVGAAIVDATGRPPIADGVVVVRDGRIADVGTRGDVTIP